MKRPLSVRPRTLYLFFLLLTVGQFASAQLTIERELLGAVVVTEVTQNSGGDLLIEASFGEQVIDVSRGGGLIVTAGFHQTRTSPDGGNLTDPDPGVVRVPSETERVTALAFPNPAYDRLTLDLKEHQGQIVHLQVADIFGKIVHRRKLGEEQFVDLTKVTDLPAATYYISGIDRSGKLIHLTSVVIVVH